MSEGADREVEMEVEVVPEAEAAVPSRAAVTRREALSEGADKGSD